MPKQEVVRVIRLQRVISYNRGPKHYTCISVSIQYTDFLNATAEVGLASDVDALPMVCLVLASTCFDIHFVRFA